MTDAASMTVMANTSATGAAADGSRLTFGIDLGDRHSHLCVLDGSGAIAEEGRLQTNASSFRQRFAGAAPARIAIEVGTHSPWVNARPGGQRAERAGDLRQRQEVRPRRRRATGAICADGPEAAVADRAARQGVAGRSRSVAVEVGAGRRTHADGEPRSRLHEVVRRTALRLHMATFARRAAWRIPRELRRALVPILRTIAELTQRIVAFESRIERLGAERHPETKRLRQVDGVGPITSRAFVLTPEDPRRYRTSRVAGAYLGLGQARGLSAGRRQKAGG